MNGLYKDKWVKTKKKTTGKWNFTPLGWICITLTAILVIGKAFGFTDWEWKWIFAPLWMPCGASIVLVMIGTFLIFLGEALK